MNYMPYKFSSSAYADMPVASSQEQDPTLFLIQRAFGPDSLNRQERNRLAEIMYGVFGSGHTYRLVGWAWNMSVAQQLRRILVADVGGLTFRTYFAADKLALRTVLDSQAEMIYPEPRQDDSLEEIPADDW